MNNSLLPGLRLTLLVPVICLAAALVGCDVDTYWRSGDYELIAIDVKGQMALSVDLHNGGSIALVGPTVFSLGTNDKYIVVKQHPATDEFGNFNRSATNYFVIARLPGSSEDKAKGVRGPMTKEQFDMLSRTLRLPPFTKVFDDLE